MNTITEEAGTMIRSKAVEVRLVGAAPAAAWKPARRAHWNQQATVS